MSQLQEPTNLAPFRLGEWEVRRDEGLLCSGDRSVRLEPRVMDVLVHLAAHPDRMVSKEELLAEVWGGAFVEEGALSQAIHSLRKALGDDARQPRFIQTVPKRGYRLVAAVVQEPKPRAAGTSAESPGVPPSVSRAVPAQPARRWRWLLLAILGLAIGLGLVGARARILGRGSAGETRGVRPMRIVVLPFEDLGRSPDPFFTVGLTQEITKDLGSIPSLQVMYRPVVDPAKERLRQPHEIARELGANYVLLGSVQWEPRPGGRPRVRIRPRLIGVDGVQAWTDSFDSDIEDVLDVQAEISHQVIDSLDLNLSPEQRRPLRQPASEDAEARQAYFRGLALKDQPFYSEEQLLKAAINFQRAVDLDPGFAAAWAELSMVHSYLAYNTDPTSDRVNHARQALEQAMKLGPDLAEVRLAQAYYTYRCKEDFDTALAQLDAAAKLYPNDPEVYKTFGLLLRRKGRFHEAIKAFKHAEWLDPRTGEIVWLLPETYRAMRNFKEADRGFAQAISQASDEPFFWAELALNQLAWTGDPEKARKILDKSGLSGDPEIEMVASRLDLYEGKYDEALAGLSGEWVQRVAPETKARIDMVAAIARERSGDHRGALATAEENRAFLNEMVARYPNRALFRSCLAVALAQLGRYQDALLEAQRAAQMRHSDAFSGPRIIEIQAMVDVILGRHREALDRLASLLSTPYRGSITTTDLRLDPIWINLRSDPGFEALLGRYEN